MKINCNRFKIIKTLILIYILFVILFNKLIIAHRQQRGLAFISPFTTVHFC